MIKFKIPDKYTLEDQERSVFLLIGVSATNKRFLISNARLKFTKNQANAKQHPETELLLFEIYSHFSPRLSSKNNCLF